MQNRFWQNADTIFGKKCWFIVFLCRKKAMWPKYLLIVKLRENITLSGRRWISPWQQQRRRQLRSRQRRRLQRRRQRRRNNILHPTLQFFSRDFSYFLRLIKIRDKSHQKPHREDCSLQPWKNLISNHRILFPCVSPRYSAHTLINEHQHPWINTGLRNALVTNCR